MMDKKITLKYADKDDVQFLLGLKNNHDLQKKALAPIRDFTKDDIEKWIQRYADSSDAFLLVIVNQNNESLGYISLQNLDIPSRSIRFGIVISLGHQGKGVGFLALTELTKLCAGELHIKKIVLDVLPANKNAIKLYEKFGFRHQGISQNKLKVDGRFVDLVTMDFTIA